MLNIDGFSPKKQARPLRPSAASGKIGCVFMPNFPGRAAWKPRLQTAARLAPRLAQRLIWLAQRLIWLWLLLIVIFGAGLRFTGLRWDEQTHVHPDERFISMVASAIALPDSGRAYFTVETSPLSPYNTDLKNYLYGQFPLSLTKWVAAKTGRDSYDELYIVGRALGAGADTLSIVLVFLAARWLCAPRRPASDRVASDRATDLGDVNLGDVERPYLVALTAALAYACCVLAIQSAHFFTMESWLILWSLTTFCGALGLLRARTRLGVALCLGVCVAGLALAMSCKAQGVLMALTVVIAVIWRWGRVRRWDRLLWVTLAGVLASALLYRIISPYTFANSSWLDWRANPNLVDSLRTQAAFMNGEAMFPPQYQWLLTRPWIGPARNLLVWATGPFVGVAALLGLGLLAWRTLQGRRSLADSPATIGRVMLLALALVVWCASAGRFVHTVRYLAPLLPLLCLCAAFFAAQGFASRKWTLALCALVTLPTALYALAFVSIYQRPTPLVAASRFLHEAAPQGAVAAGEHWDLVLPLPLGSGNAGWQTRELPSFDADADVGKIDRLYDVLRGADFFSLASPRAWGNIGKLPGEYPLMARFYQRLFAGDLGFTPIAVFESPPRLGALTIPDSSAEESFWVYDHPQVIVFQHISELTRQEFRAQLEKPYNACDQIEIKNGVAQLATAPTPGPARAR